MVLWHPDYCTCGDCTDTTRRTMEKAHGFGWQLRRDVIAAEVADADDPLPPNDSYTVNGSLL